MYLNKILIFAGAKESILLLEKITSNYLNLGEFHIIYQNEEIVKNIEKKENLFCYKINFFAYEAYKNLINQHFNKIIVFVKNKKEAIFLINKLKFTKTPIVFIKFWMELGEVELNYPNVEILDIPEIITNKIIDFLPGVPLFARDIGLGKGELMEVEVPPFSPFIYKSPNYIEDMYKAKVAAIYRENNLKEINSHTIILPNDNLLIIGKPEILRELYTQIRKNLGSFPQPYGQNIYTILDMSNLTKKETYKILKSALFLHRKLKNKKLIIRIINPNLSIKLYKLHKFPNIDIVTDYHISSYEEILQEDTNKLNIGLIITNNKFFKKHSKRFFETKKPILKLGQDSIKECKNLTVILHKNNIKRIASSIFDLAYQLDKKLRFFNADPENSNKDLVEYLKHLAKLFGFNNVEFTSTKDNPIRKLNKDEKNENFCLIETFSKPVNPIKQILFPKIEYSYLFLKRFNQFLIPTLKDEYES